jgi:hypothetical protein
MEIWLHYVLVKIGYLILTLEILGLDPKITICKIAVLPIKLYPLLYKLTITYILTKPKRGSNPRIQQWKCRVLTTWLLGLFLINSAAFLMDKKDKISPFSLFSPQYSTFYILVAIINLFSCETILLFLVKLIISFLTSLLFKSC